MPFHGLHQAGIDRPRVPQAAAVVAAFDVFAADRRELARLLRDLTVRARALADATPPTPADRDGPPPESGILGESVGPADLTITVGVGASLFDDRYGLADRRPWHLTEMPQFPNDELDPDRTHGDLLIQVCGADAAACIHALRSLVRESGHDMALRWMIEGFQPRDEPAGDGRTVTRNLLGFQDGTANPTGAHLDDLVWIQPGDQEPEWTVGGSYGVIRIIRMFVERWDDTALGDQEAVIGRTRLSGAPLGMERAEDDPDYPSDPGGRRIPLDAHIRLADPRTPGTERNRILRRSYAYSRGLDTALRMDQGQVFICFQRDLAAGFATVQERLTGEPLERYVRPIGGGYFFMLPGVQEPGEWLGSTLLG